MTPTRKNKASARKKRNRNLGAAGAAFLVAACGIIVWKSSSFGGSADNTSASTLRPAPAVTDGRVEGSSAKPAPSAAPSAAAPSPTATPSPGGTASPSPQNVPAGAAGNDRVNLAFVGDVLLGSTVENLMKQKGYDAPYKGVADYLSKPDLTIANLETPITERGAVQKKEYVYRSLPLALPAFKNAGFDLVNLANNHVMDYGAEGLTDTFAHLQNNAIRYTGAGGNAAEAFRPAIVEKNGMKIAFLGFSRVVPDNSWKAGAGHPGVADAYNPNLPVQAIQKARAQADLVIVIAHWGVERKDTPEAYETDLAHKFVDAGADLVIGGHPHVLQGFEQYKGKWIAYSLGNFIFTTNSVKETLDSMILNASCSKDRSCELSAVPVFTQWAQPVVISAEDGGKLFERLSKVSFGAAVDSNGSIHTK